MSGGDLPLSRPPARPARDLGPPEGVLARLASRFTAWAERWIPDAFVFALVATFAVVAASFLALVGTHGTFEASKVVVLTWGGGFWELLPFTLQMALVIITGHVVASSRPVRGLIAKLASWPASPRTAVAWVALLAMLTSWLNWGFGLVFGAMLAREVARRVAKVDYRAVCASALMGVGSIWAQGLSGSAALQMATPNAMQPALHAIVSRNGAAGDGLIALRHTIFLWQSLVSVGVEVVVVTALMYLAAPTGERSRTAADLGVDVGEAVDEPHEPDVARRGGEWLEHTPWLSMAFVALSVSYLVANFAAARDALYALNLNTLNLAFLTLGVALHKTPSRLMRAVKEATPGVWPVLLQFPFYAGIAALIVKTHLNDRIAAWFVGISTQRTLPAVVAIYSAVLGVFVPSGGSKWVIEAPYVMQSAHALEVHLGWMVAVYDLGEALANLVQPFWMLPVLGLFGLRARDVMGYTFLVFLVLAPLVLLLVTVLGATLHYPL